MRSCASYLPTRGELALHMMHATATVQANFDYASEADMVAKMRTALGVSPIVSALFANSRCRGKPERLDVAARAHLAPRGPGPLRPAALRVRAGLRLPRATSSGRSTCRCSSCCATARYLPSDGMTFRRFWPRAHGEPATLQDWDRHLTTLFPEVRLKQSSRCAAPTPCRPG
jgi:glutamate--cysteine ligase